MNFAAALIRCWLRVTPRRLWPRSCLRSRICITKTKKPPTTDADLHLDKLNCLLCPQICLTSAGRREKCGDIPPSWSVEELTK